MPQIWLSILLLLTAYISHFATIVTKYVGGYVQENNNLGLLENNYFVFN